ncbi:MAG: hypothetical protein NVS1B4_02850 [Gemmatimonadaceae bacterium]
MNRVFITSLALAAAGAPLPLLQGQLPLIPQPRELTELPPVALRGGVTITVPADSDDQFTADDLATLLRDRGVRVRVGGVPAGGGAHISLLRTGTPAARTLLRRYALTIDSAMTGEGYVLATAGERIDVIAASSAGLFYGAQTLKQLIEGEGQGARIRGAKIRDWPGMRYRGFHDDLSRGRIPTLEFQKKQMRVFAAHKLNVYSPYFEHTLEYKSNPLIAPPGGAMTREQVKELVAYARHYHIDVIPEQEAFGHLHHVLKHEIYAPLGETVHGHVLAPGQAGSLPLIRRMFAEIDSVFPSRFVHLGADETFELGRGQTADRVKGEGIGVVYLDFLKQIESALRADAPETRATGMRSADRRFLFWGDVAMNHPDLVKTLPKNLIAVAWTYDPRPSFDRFIAPFRDAGMETWVAPGVNNWNRVYPNYNLALPNIQGFIRDGQRLGATGVLNTEWGDDGEALFNQTWYAVLFGAAASWQPGESSIEQFQQRFGRSFHGDTTGKIDAAQRKLAAAHALLQKAGVGDASNALFWLDPWSGEGKVVAEQLRPVARDLRVLAESALVLVAEARPGVRRELDALDALELGARRIDLIGMKAQFADEVAAMYGRAYAATVDTSKGSPARDLSDITGINGRLQDLRDAYSLTRDLYEQAWRRENRPYWIHNVLARYDLATQLWISRADRVAHARRQWYRTRKLPNPDEMQIPALSAAR